MIAALIGTVRVNYSYTILDPSFATERLRHMKKDSSISTVLTSSNLMLPANDLHMGEINSSIGLVPDLVEQNNDNIDLVTAEYITAAMGEAYATTQFAAFRN
jgi:non-ribosomal peptide synthetase component F